VVENSWSPALCQVTSVRCLVTVGLCEEKLYPTFRSPLTSSQYAPSLYGATRYSETTWGLRSSVRGAGIVVETKPLLAAAATNREVCRRQYCSA
jgi:hypothetical protein